jgi:hypothetical protein
MSLTHRNPRSTLVQYDCASWSLEAPKRQILQLQNMIPQYLIAKHPSRSRSGECIRVASGNDRTRGAKSGRVLCILSGRPHRVK